MRQEDRVERALRVTLERFERGEWTWGQRHERRGGQDLYCLVGSLQEQLIPELKNTRYVHESDIAPAYHEALRSLGFGCEVQAYTFNDVRGLDGVIGRLRGALRGEYRYTLLHQALDESRVEHAKRDLGRKVPNVVPLAWMEQQFTETFAEKVQV